MGPVHAFVEKKREGEKRRKEERGEGGP